MGRWVIALIAGAALVAAPSASPQIVVAQTVFHRADLPSNAITGLNVTCPPGYVAVSGGNSTAAPGVTTLSIRPAGLRTYAFRFGNPEMNERMVRRTAMRRTGEPQDVANAVAFMCSDLAGYITGIGLNVSGGIELFTF